MYTKSGHTHLLTSQVLTPIKAPTKLAIYCAIVLGVAGCASSTSDAVANDPLNQDKVAARASSMPSLNYAKALVEKSAAAQKLADEQLVVNKAACLKKFLVNHCINLASQERNRIWDNAQIDATAARYAIRQYEANTNRATLQAKVAAYDAEQAALAPTRKANAIAYAAKVKALNERIAQADKITPEQRAENVTLFEQKRNRILEIQRKRIEENRLRTEAAAQKAAKAAAAAATK